MEALASPLIGFALKQVPSLIGALAGDNAGAVAKKIVDVAGSIFGTTDPTQIAAAEAAKLDAFKTVLGALAGSDKAQAATNTAEAASPFFFVAGWRPAVGWICVVGLAYQFALFPFLVWISDISKIAAPPPLDISQLMTLLTGMLGLAVVRSYDKLQCIDTKSLAGIFAKK
ncbi:MAG: hypothetical protein GC182_08815 [Rhodopseudomonas sp.]|nr:hypothetical protein [Rhodopseudomonas sp.]